VTKSVVAPDHGRSLVPGLHNAATEWRPIRSFAHDARADAHGPHELAKVQKHHVPIALAVAIEVVAMLLAVAKEQTRSAEPLQFPERVAVRDVITVRLRTFKIRDEQKVQVVRSRESAQILVGLLAREAAQVQVRVAAEPAGACSVEERFEGQINLGLR